MTGPLSPSQQEGPTHSPPRLPNGYVAQWDGSSKQFYYVETATGVSSWTIPESASLSIPDVQPTPRPIGGSMYGVPASGEPGNPAENPEGADRGLVTDLASNVLLGRHGKPQNASGSSSLGGLATQFLGGSGNNNASSGNHGSSGIGVLAGQLVGSLLDKPTRPSDGRPSSSASYGYQSNYASNNAAPAHTNPVSSAPYSPSSGNSGFMGMAAGFLGGHHGQTNNFGYKPAPGASSTTYDGEEPPKTYQPAPGPYSAASASQSGMLGAADTRPSGSNPNSFSHQNVSSHSAYPPAVDAHPQAYSSSSNMHHPQYPAQHHNFQGDSQSWSPHPPNSGSFGSTPMSTQGSHSSQPHSGINVGYEQQYGQQYNNYSQPNQPHTYGQPPDYAGPAAHSAYPQAPYQSQPWR